MPPRQLVLLHLAWGVRFAQQMGSDQRSMKLKRYSCPSPWELLFIQRQREGLLEK